MGCKATWQVVHGHDQLNFCQRKLKNRKNGVGLGTRLGHCRVSVRNKAAFILVTEERLIDCGMFVVALVATLLAQEINFTPSWYRKLIVHCFVICTFHTLSALLFFLCHQMFRGFSMTSRIVIH